MVHASEQTREDVKLLRWHYGRTQRHLDVERLWFFDESGVNLSMTRAYGRGPRGQRVVGHVPKNWGESETLMAGIGVRGVIAPMLVHGSLTGAVFEHYLAEFVAPHLHQDDILVLDNLGAHRTESARRIIEDRGAHLLFLPPYSPDLNPIELAWSKVKTLVRGAAARTLEDLVSAVAIALRRLTPGDIAAWIRHCGYLIN